jgi:phosphatidate cytidylyltransferase
VEANLRSRLLTASIGIPLLIFVVGWGEPWLFTVVIFLLTVSALREYFVMAFPGRPQDQVAGVFFGIALFCLMTVNQGAGLQIGLGLLLAIFFSIYLFMQGPMEERLRCLAYALLGAFYLGYLMPHWVVLFRLPDGRAWVFFVLAVIMAGDTLAYFVGKAFGTRKLAARISPGKTVEGAVGYVLGSIMAAGLLVQFLAIGMSWLELLAVTLILSIFGQVGDLFESWMKRSFAVKDSGMSLPGHGGFMDRLDSLILPAVFTTTYLRVFHP